jgi:hypothetical protein
LCVIGAAFHNSILTRITQYHLFGFFPVELEKIEFVFFFVLEALLNQAPTNQDKTEKRKKTVFNFNCSSSPKMQQPSIGGWSVALAALFLLNAAFINANQGRIMNSH